MRAWATKRNLLIAAQAVAVVGVSVAVYFGLLKPSSPKPLPGLTAPGRQGPTYSTTPGGAHHRPPGHARRARHAGRPAGHVAGRATRVRRYAGAATAAAGAGAPTPRGPAAHAAAPPASTSPGQTQYQGAVAAIAGKLGTLPPRPP